MSDHPVSIALLLGDTRAVVDDVVATGRGADGAGIGLETAVRAAGGQVDSAVRGACDVDLVDLLVQGWSKAHELRGYADLAAHPPGQTARVVLAKHPMALTIDPALKLQALPLVNWPLKLLVGLEAMINAATLVIRDGRIVAVELGAIGLSAELRWGDTKLPLPCKHELGALGTVRLDPPGVAIPAMG